MNILLIEDCTLLAVALYARYLQGHGKSLKALNLKTGFKALKSLKFWS